MQVGDKKKASVLGVIAVGAVGFVIFQLVPKAEGRPQANAPTPTPPASGDLPPGTPKPTTPVTDASRVALQRDPFAVASKPNPRLSVGTGRSDTSSVPGQSSSPSLGKALGQALGISRPADPLARGSGEQQLPPAGISSGPYDAGMSVAVPKGANTPKSGSGKNGSSKGTGVEPKASEPAPPPAQIAVRLLGIVESTRMVALLMVGDREKTARLGDEIVPGIRIETIGLDGISFTKKPGARLAPQTPTSGRLALGEEISL